MLRLSLLCITALFLSSCSHYVWRTYKKKETNTSSGCDVALVRIHPSDSIADKVGEIIMDDLGFSVDCNEEETINYLKKEACTLGAEIILVKQIKRPDLSSYCYRCTAIFYKLKPGANPVETRKYFEQERIEKRDQKDMKKKIGRTMVLIAETWHIIKMFLHFEPHHSKDK